jgi:plastocyanin
VPNSVRIFRSDSVNYDPGGRVSWDMSMTTTNPTWRIAVRPGDRLRVRAAYDTSKGSWYESMGIMIVWMADSDKSGVDPFSHTVASTGAVTHGPLPENAPGGGVAQGLPDPATLPGIQSPLDTVNITDFQFLPGDQTLSGPLGSIPTVRPGQPLNFVNLDAGLGIYHTITACRAPCSSTYGASYPLANGTADFDSGQLGIGPPGLTAAAQRVTWQTPTSLAPGTYTFFCRIHPWMRGAFRIVRG